MQPVSVSTGADGALDVVLTGEIDFTNSARVVGAIRDGAGRTAPAAIRVDLAGVTFLDSSGIGVLVHAMRLAEERDVGFVVEHPNPKVFDQLRMSGLLEPFGLPDSSPEA